MSHTPSPHISEFQFFFEGRIGLLENLTLQHFYECSIVVNGGRWRLRRVRIESSRPSRACAAIVLRGGASVELDACELTGCSCALQLASPNCSLYAFDSSFANVRAAIAAEKGGRVELERCTFQVQPPDVAMRLSSDTVGRLRGSAAALPGGDALFGRGRPPPPGFVLALDDSGDNGSQPTSELNADDEYQ